MWMRIRRKVSMAREYHNLRGIVRDITRALREGDYSEVAAFVDLLDDFADAREGVDEDSSVEDAEDTSGESGQLDLDVRDGDDRLEVGGPSPGHGAVRNSALAQSPSVAATMERARRLARSAIQQQRHADAVAPTELRYGARVTLGKGP